MYGIYTDCIRNIHKYLWHKIIKNTNPMGRPPKAAPVCLMDILMDIYGYVINIYGYISYTFLIYSIYAYMFPRYVPCIFPCVFLNLWSQEEVRTCPNSDLWSQEEVRT